MEHYSDKYVPVSQMGYVYRLTRRRWRAFLQEWAGSGTQPDAADYGVYIGTLEAVTDWGTHDVSSALEFAEEGGAG